MKVTKSMDQLISQKQNKQLDPHIPAVNNTPKYMKETAPTQEKIHSFSLQNYKD